MKTSQTVIGILGNIVSMGLFLSPVPTMLKIMKKKSTQNFVPLPYVCTLLNCLLWLFYGSPWVEKGILVMTINGFGTTVELVYLTIFIVLASTRKTRIRTATMLTCAFGFFAILVTFNMTLVHGNTRRKTVVGVVAVIVGTAMYAAPFSIMRTVVRTKSTKYMPFFLSLFSFFNGVLWMTYALIGHDIYITVPNAIGTALSVSQLVLYACYCRGTDDADEPHVAADKIAETDVEVAHARGNEKHGEQVNGIMDRN